MSSKHVDPATLKVVRLSSVDEGECGIGDCCGVAHPYAAEGYEGYVDTCREHAAVALACEIEGGFILPKGA